MGERAPGALCCRFKPGAYHRHPVLLSLPGQRCYWCDYRDILSNCHGPDMPMSSQTPFSCAHGPGQANSCTVRIVYRTHSSLVSGQSQMLHFDDCYLLKHCSPSPFESAHIPSSRGQRTFLCSRLRNVSEDTPVSLPPALISPYPLPDTSSAVIQRCTPRMR